MFDFLPDKHKTDILGAWFTALFSATVLFFVFGFNIVTIVIVSIIISIVVLASKTHIDYPDMFRGECGACGLKHGRSKYIPTFIDEELSYEKGYVFLSKSCLDDWNKIHTHCSNCNFVFGREYLEPWMEQKYKTDYYHFCSERCKENFYNENHHLISPKHKRHSISSELRKIVFERDEGKCVKCGSDENIHFDHIIPVSKGGSTTLENLELLCQSCNLSKSDKIE